MGERFLRYLRLKGVSQRELAAMAGVSASLVSRLCSGGSVSSDNLVKIVSVCPDLSLDYLFRGEGPAVRPPGGVFLCRDIDSSHSGWACPFLPRR